MKKMLSVNETAKQFGLSRYEIRNGLKSGKYPGFKVGVGRGMFLIDEELFAETLTKLSLGNIAATQNDIAFSNDVRVIEYGQLRKMVRKE